MSTTKPSIVLVPGAWQKPVAFAPFVQQLNDLGYPSEIIPNASVGGTGSPLPGLPEDVTRVQAALGRRADKGEDIILLCHSYGGVVGSCSVEGFDYASRKKAGKKGGVVITIYMTAFMVPKGLSLMDMLGGQPLPWMKIEGDKCTIVSREAFEHAGFNDLSDELTAQYAPEMTHTSVSVFGTPSTYEPWANGLACAYIFCTEDHAVQYEQQQQMARQLGPEPTTYTLEAGHLPFLSMPDRLADVVGKAASLGLSKKDAA